jgi:hypothetical protein
MRAFFPDPAFGLAQIHLGPATSHNLVVCADSLDTVLDQGTDNKDVGGWLQATNSLNAFTVKGAPAMSVVRPIPQRRKPFRR